MGFETPSVPKAEEAGERVEDVAKAQEMAQAGNADRSAVSGSSKFNEAITSRPMPGLREEFDEADKAAAELRNDPAKAEAKRGHLDDLHTREYVADEIKRRLQATEKSADIKEEIAGIVYDLQNSPNLSEEAIRQIKEIISQSK